MITEVGSRLLWDRIVDEVERFTAAADAGEPVVLPETPVLECDCATCLGAVVMQEYVTAIENAVEDAVVIDPDQASPDSARLENAIAAWGDHLVREAFKRARLFGAGWPVEAAARGDLTGVFIATRKHAA